jgi:hypothetical protein
LATEFPEQQLILDLIQLGKYEFRRSGVVSTLQASATGTPSAISAISRLPLGLGAVHVCLATLFVPANELTGQHCIVLKTIHNGVSAENCGARFHLLRN